jgi:hypothetical protein
MTREALAFTVACCAALAVGCERDADSIVSAEVVSVTKMPFHGPNGPGTEPISITFRWTVVLEAHQGPACRIDRIATELSEPVSGTVLNAETEPGSSGQLSSGQREEFAQSQSGRFDSGLYQRPWTGRTLVEVTLANGRSEQLGVEFAIP